MGFRDILKKTFLEGMASTDISTARIIVTLAIAGAIGLYIFGVYRVMTRKAFYSKSFNVSLVALGLLTAAIILAIQSSVVISLGMVGALSIVRFRTAVKDPLDLVFLFWSISVGIICGAGLYEMAALVSIAVTVLVFALEMLPGAKAPMLLVVDADNADLEPGLLEIVKSHAGHYKVKSRNLTKQGMDMVIELRIKDGGQMVREIGDLDGVLTVSLMSHDGEVTF